MKEYLLIYMYAFNIFIAIYLIVYVSYLLFSGIVGTIVMLRKKRLELMHNYLDHEYYYPISIIVPMYNEGKSGVECVQNLFNLDYKLYEIVVVDDGSKDDTKRLVIDAFNLKPDFYRPIRLKIPCKPIKEIYKGNVNGINITLIHKENGGCKADAVNAGINASTFSYFLCMDGDEILQKDCLKYAARALLEDDRTIAVGGNIKISNSVTFKDAMPIKRNYGENILVDIQTLEYSRGFIGARVFQNMINANLIISGGFGIFRKQAVIDVGGYDPESIGEDMELTTKLHKHFRKNKMKYLMKYAPESICWTQGPEDLRDISKQRERWHMGLRQTLFIYRSMILNPRYGVLGLFMIPYMILYEFLYPIIMVMGIVSISIGAYFHLINWWYAIFYFLVYVLFNILLGSISYFGNYLLENEKINWKEIIHYFLIGVFDALIFRQYLTLVTFFATFKSRKKTKWHSPKRIENKIENK